MTALTAVAGYAAYFDYKRRNDAAFRRRLREFHMREMVFFLYAEVCFLGKEQKRAHRTAIKASGSAEEGPSKEVLREALEKVKSEKVPDSPEDREQYFMQNVSVGEQLCAQGMVLLPSMN